MKAYWEWRCISIILDLNTTSAELQIPVALPRGKNLRYPLHRRLGGLQRRSGCCGAETILFPLLGVQPVALRYTD
jgi:hypothetical protein